ncbi:SAP domain-containing protein [Motilibacter rhizosphaerae]|uniref:SAP domain-containing protein n=1 Tax=Motilibacter rhizosphaerae TaxID=598652 RepID=A0A4Q7NPD1_9ACTN|nr:helicase-associated domain-containing protein [Motilibacter rhizosphaerae]RZS86878.1 SAP domain-containing protein [Motilibacter rhizosphaerae]
MRTLAEHLASLSPDALADLLSLRADALAEPRPETLGDLAARLESGMSGMRALSLVDGHGFAIAQAAAALGDGFTTADLESLVPEPAGTARAALEELARRGLVWRDGEEWRSSRGFRRLFPDALGLGPALEEVLEGYTVAELRDYLSAHGISPDGRRAVLLQRLLHRLRDPDTTAAVLSGGPPGTVELFSRLLVEPLTELDYPDYIAGHRSSRYARTDRPGAWLLQMGVLHRVDYGQAVLPRDIHLAIARAMGTPETVPLRPAPPAPVPVAVEVTAVERACAGAAAACLDTCRAVLEAVASAPPPALKTGGLGVREVRRLAKEIGRGEQEIAFALQVAGEAGLADGTGDSVLVTPAYDEWSAAAPEQRYAVLLAAWWGMASTPGRPVGREARGSVLTAPPRTQVAATPERLLRHDLIRTLVALGGAVPWEPLTAWRAFQRPLAFPDELADHAASVAEEAERLGVVALDAAGPAARALVEGSVDDLLAAARALVPSAGTVATFQADLTALVAGSPPAGLSALLGSLADVESRGAATVWRFSAGSVRRAFDAGATAEGIVADLERVAAKLPLPQPLTYLVHDVARRHGAVHVVPVACCVVGQDAALLAEVVRTRALAGLGLRALAPTVLAGAKPPEATLDALRAAGYAPVLEDTSGAIVIERAAVRRSATTARTGSLALVLPPASEGLESAVHGLEAAAAAARSLSGTSTGLGTVRQAGGLRLSEPAQDRLGNDGVRVLHWALRTGRPVQLHYVDDRDRHHRVVARGLKALPGTLLFNVEGGPSYAHIGIGELVAVGPVLPTP